MLYIAIPRVSVRVFSLYCPWVDWSRSELNSWPSSHSIDPQRDPRASKLEALSWPITPNVDGPKSFSYLHKERPNNCLQVKGPTSYLINCLHRKGSNNCLQVKGPTFLLAYMLYWFICICAFLHEENIIISTCRTHMYPCAWWCMRILHKPLHMLHTLLSSFLHVWFPCT